MNIEYEAFQVKGWCSVAPVDRETLASPHADGADVTIIGLGRMGRALAMALLASGKRVAVWNRDRAKAAALAEEGALVADTLDAAVGLSSTIIVCLSSYSVWSNLLEGLGPRTISGRLIVQLSTGAPDEAARLADLQAGQGADSLDGAIFAFPEAVGSARCTICLAGPAQEYGDAKAILAGLGELRHMGEDIRAANALDTALLVYSFGARIAYLQAAALFESAGFPLGELAQSGAAVSKGLEPWIEEVTSALAEGAYEGDQATLQTFHGVWSMARAFAERQRLPTTLLTAFETLSESAIRRGHGESEFPALMEALRGPG